MSVDAASPSPSEPSAAFWQSITRAQAAVHSLSLVLGPLVEPLSLSDDPAATLLQDADVARAISHRLRSPGSGAGDDNLCRWLYDTFQSSDPNLQLVVLNFVPTLVGVYLPRAIAREPLAGFEAVILALYAHETGARNGEPQTVSLPNLANPSVYHEVKAPAKKGMAEPELEVAVISPPLEPHGTIRSTKRARIVGAALELCYSKISRMSVASKLDFCEFCVAWAGQDGMLAEKNKSATEPDATSSDEHQEKISGDGVSKETVQWRRIPLPWELFQPILRILGHCILGLSDPSEELKSAAYMAVGCLHSRATHDMNSRAILATRSLLRLGKMAADNIREPSISSDSGENPELEVA